MTEERVRSCQCKLEKALTIADTGPLLHRERCQQLCASRQKNGSGEVSRPEKGGVSWRLQNYGQMQIIC